MWLENLKELKKKSGMNCKQIASGTLMSERTVVRIFSGETPNPTITTLLPIIKFLGGSSSEIFSDTTAVVGDANLAALQEELNAVTAERDLAVTKLNIAEDKVATLTAENDLLKMQLMHKEELLAVHNYYIKMNGNH